MKLSDIRKLNQEFAGLSAPAQLQNAAALLRSIGIDPNNLYQELEMESDTVDTHRDVSWPNSSMNLHSHSFMEILCCANTCGVEYLVGTERYRLQKGDIVMVPPGVSHRPLLPEQMEEPYIRDVLWINPDFLDKLHQRYRDEKLYNVDGAKLLRTAGTKWEFLGDLFRRGVREAEQRQHGWEALVLGNTIQILVHLGRAVLDRSARPLRAEAPELLDQVFAYTEAHLHGRITLADTAKRFYVSESTISHLFKQKLGVSFYRYVTQRRLIAAKTLIEKGIFLEDVARQTGFQDYSGFYRAFKQEYGISPRQYRRVQELGSKNQSLAFTLD